MIVAEARSVTKTYYQAETPIEVLRGADLQIAQGETVAIVGQSGSGKSTLLTLLAGLDRPSGGQVWLAGHDVGTMTEAALIGYRARHLSIVFQQFHLMPYLSALENVSLPLEIQRIKESDGPAEAALRAVGLGHRLRHLPAQMSGGERQRVAIARALVVRPHLLLADEPSGNLDTRTGEEVMDLLFEQVRASQMAMILVTHNEALARRCARQLNLRDGKLV